MTPDRIVAILQLAIVLLTGVVSIVSPALQPWVHVLIAAIAAVLLYVFGVSQPIAKAAAKANLNAKAEKPVK